MVCIGCSKYPEKDLVQKLALLFWTFHYAKRILETFFVHRYSQSLSMSHTITVRHTACRKSPPLTAALQAVWWTDCGFLTESF